MSSYGKLPDDVLEMMRQSAKGAGDVYRHRLEEDGAYKPEDVPQSVKDFLSDKEPIDQEQLHWIGVERYIYHKYPGKPIHSKADAKYCDVYRGGGVYGPLSVYPNVQYPADEEYKWGPKEGKGFEDFPQKVFRMKSRKITWEDKSGVSFKKAPAWCGRPGSQNICNQDVKSVLEEYIPPEHIRFLPIEVEKGGGPIPSGDYWFFDIVHFIQGIDLEYSCMSWSHWVNHNRYRTLGTSG